MPVTISKNKGIQKFSSIEELNELIAENAGSPLTAWCDVSITMGQVTFSRDTWFFISNCNLNGIMIGFGRHAGNSGTTPKALICHNPSFGWTADLI